MSTSSDETTKAAREIANLILSGKAKRLVFLTGAGTSVASGIPDFRSPGGMYDTLKPELLTGSKEDRDAMADNPTHVVNKALFMHNPLPYHEVRRPFIIGTGVKQWKPTLVHAFFRVCQDKGLLKRLYTQNIDSLDFHVGLDPAKIVCVHGTIRQTICEFCLKDPYAGDFDAYIGDVKKNIKDIYGIDPTAPKESTPILCKLCGKAGVKPATVLYGGAMPTAFRTAIEEDFEKEETAPDMMFVVGSSLTVFPAAGLPEFMPKGKPKVLINRERVGMQLFSPLTDYFLLGDVDRIIVKLAGLLGWLHDLNHHRKLMCESSVQLLDQALHQEL